MMMMMIMLQLTIVLFVMLGTCAQSTMTVCVYIATVKNGSEYNVHRKTKRAQDDH